MRESHPSAPTAECAAAGYPACVGQLARIEAKLDTLCEQHRDAEARLRTLEDAHSQAKGGARVAHLVAVTLGGVAGALASWLVSTFKPHP